MAQQLLPRNLPPAARDPYILFLIEGRQSERDRFVKALLRSWQSAVYDGLPDVVSLSSDGGDSDSDFFFSWRRRAVRAQVHALHCTHCRRLAAQALVALPKAVPKPSLHQSLRKQRQAHLTERRNHQQRRR